MYKTSTKLPQERILIIGDSLKSSKENFTFYEYQNKRVDLPVIRVDITLPVYRMENYRTRTAQIKYIHANKERPDFFSSGQENESAQQAQHEILIPFAKQGRADSISPIIEELQIEEQREPILITSGGVVVNGNRRLTAMRELWSENPGDFKRFQYVDCAVLPDSVTPEEIREIEVRLQMRPETKLPYGWVDESIAITEMLTSGKSVDYVADLMKKKRRDVERMARALTEADIYLKEWLREPGEYQHIEDAEQFFNDMAKALSNKEGEELEASRRIAWSLISNSKRLNRRVYDYNFGFDKRASSVIDQVCDRLGIDASEKEKKSDSSFDLDIDFGGDDEDASSFDGFIKIFDDPFLRENAVSEIISVCESIWEQDRQGEIGKRALVSLQTANSKLQEVDLTKADPSTYEAMQSQTTAIIEKAQKIQESLSRYTSKSPSS